MSNRSLIMNSYDQPCIEMMIPINVHEGKGTDLAVGFLSLSIPYATDIFQEIQNVKDFNIETLWSSAGGFVGIFLGYSLLQIPEIFDVKWKDHLKKMVFYSCFTKIFATLMGCLNGGGKQKRMINMNGYK